MRKHTPRGIRHLALTTLSLAILAACGGGGDGPSMPAPQSTGAQKETVVAAAAPAEAPAPDRTVAPTVLPDTVWPSNYKMWFRPDAKLETFNGRGDVEIEVRKPVDAIEFLARNLTFTKGTATLRKLDATATVPLELAQTSGSEIVKARLKSGKVEAGKYVLHMEWSGKIQFTEPFGLFKVGLDRGSANDALVTQGETNYARQWFPGWDEPAFRHTFEITAEVPGKWQTASNGAQKTTEKLSDGYQRVSFEKSPSMPMYLTFFGGGNFSILSDTFKSSLDNKEIALRWLGPPDRSDLLRTAMNWTKEVTEHFYQYTGIPLPLNKLDSVAATDVYKNKRAPFGAMENWGSIFYFADSVVTKPGVKPTAYAMQVVAHEMAHQWFGNLVTLDWWDDIWLNESFASWADQHAMIKFQPKLFNATSLVAQKHQIFEHDLKNTAYPVQRTLTDANSMTYVTDSSKFVYGKGSHVLHTIENYLGADAMKKGLQIYLKDYAYGNATPARLWTALEKAADGKKVSAIGDSLVQKTGVPLLKVEAQCTGNSSTYLSITQQALPGQNSRNAATQWTLPVTLAYGEGMSERKTIVLDRLSTNLTLPGCSAVLANPTGQDYYVTNYDESSWSKLLANINNFSGDEPLLVNLQSDAERLLSVGEITSTQKRAIDRAISKLPRRIMKSQDGVEDDNQPVYPSPTDPLVFPHAVRHHGNDLSLRDQASR